jgi:hypothetical protein
MEAEPSIIERLRIPIASQSELEGWSEVTVPLSLARESGLITSCWSTLGRAGLAPAWMGIG